MSFINQVIVILGDIHVANNQFKFTGKCGCFYIWLGQSVASRYLGVNIRLCTSDVRVLHADIFAEAF